jgi:hypothetical protein
MLPQGQAAHSVWATAPLPLPPLDGDGPHDDDFTRHSPHPRLDPPYPSTSTGYHHPLPHNGTSYPAYPLYYSREPGQPGSEQHFLDPHNAPNFLPISHASGSSMVLSNPVPDYLVAAGSSPFTLQAQAPHFQPRPRPLAQARRANMYEPNMFDASVDARAEWDYQQQHAQQQQQQQSLPPHASGQFATPRAYPRPQQQQQQGFLPLGGLSDPRYPPYVPQPDDRNGPQAFHYGPGPVRDDVNGLDEREGTAGMLRGVKAEPGVPRGRDGTELVDDEAETYNASGKKLRKKRRLKGELPRDHAARRYKCVECEQKFARPR